MILLLHTTLQISIGGIVEGSEILHAVALVEGRCWVWPFTHFLHLLSLVLTFLSFRPVPLNDKTPYFLTFLIHFIVMLLCCILPNKYEALFLFVAN